mmetsp:Transcript_4334/g.13533  ORF Transcript_4334/g.13533 Transcript_4334/m.13533 type:complete len:503 (+) Transcript_4334:271-1779(+)
MPGIEERRQVLAEGDGAAVFGDVGLAPVEGLVGAFVGAVLVLDVDRRGRGDDVGRRVGRRGAALVRRRAGRGAAEVGGAGVGVGALFAGDVGEAQGIGGVGVVAVRDDLEGRVAAYFREVDGPEGFVGPAPDAELREVRVGAALVGRATRHAVRFHVADDGIFGLGRVVREEVARRVIVIIVHKPHGVIAQGVRVAVDVRRRASAVPEADAEDVHAVLVQFVGRLEQRSPGCHAAAGRRRAGRAVDPHVDVRPVRARVEVHQLDVAVKRLDRRRLGARVAARPHPAQPRCPGVEVVERQVPRRRLQLTRGRRHQRRQVRRACQVRHRQLRLLDRQRRHARHKHHHHHHHHRRSLLPSSSLLLLVSVAALLLFLACLSLPRLGLLLRREGLFVSCTPPSLSHIHMMPFSSLPSFLPPSKKLSFSRSFLLLRETTAVVRAPHVTTPPSSLHLAVASSLLLVCSHPPLLRTIPPCCVSSLLPSSSPRAPPSSAHPPSSFFALAAS